MDKCDICGKPLGDDTYHIGMIVGHYKCVMKHFWKGFNED